MSTAATSWPPPWRGVSRLADADAVARATAHLVIEAGAERLAHAPRFHLALAGGSTPRRMFAHLATAKAALDWSRVTWWWGDERAVPPEHAESNYGSARAALLEPLGVAPAAVWRMRGEAADLPAAAHDYQRALCATLGDPPIFDLALLGLGADGHTASWFPGSPALAATGPDAPWVVANPVDSPLTGGPTTRLTLTPRALTLARRLAVSVTGADKAEAVRRALRGPPAPAQTPAQLLASAAARVQWIIDDAAAADLDLDAPRR